MTRREAFVTRKGQKIVREKGSREYKCQCCYRVFLASYDALIHHCYSKGDGGLRADHSWIMDIK